MVAVLFAMTMIAIEILGNYYLEMSASYGINYLKSNIVAEPLSQDEMPSVISVINGDNVFVEDTNKYK